jgi:hypothetical protein
VPSLKEAMAGWGRDLEHKEFAVRDYGARKLAQAEDLAKDMLEKLAKSEDAEARSRASKLLERLEPGTIEVPQVVDGRPSARPAP